mmetsp:Transcript_5669/g.3272  ORF Transcript_5669/g.3272 Transcript_5669/m.3272 type:complete len:218 (-) Transcript_5669:388-1041(-)
MCKITINLEGSSGEVTYEDNKNELDKDQQEGAYFKVHASTGSASGVHYIAWNTEQTECAEEQEYADLPITKVVVLDLGDDEFEEGSIELVLEDIEAYPGYSTVPIIFTIDIAPANEVIVIPTFIPDDYNASLIVSPTTLVFGRWNTSKEFTITVDSDFSFDDTSDISLTLSFELSGEDSASYSLDAPNTEFTIKNQANADSDPPIMVSVTCAQNPCE